MAGSLRGPSGEPQGSLRVASGWLPGAYRLATRWPEGGLRVASGWLRPELLRCRGRVADCPAPRTDPGGRFFRTVTPRTSFSFRSLDILVWSTRRVNGPYIRPSLRNRAMVWRTLRLGRSRYWWRGTSRRGYLFFLRLTARGSLRPGRSGTRSAASVASNLVHSCRRFFLVRAWLIAWVNWRRASRVPLKLIRANGTVCSVAAWAMV